MPLLPSTPSSLVELLRTHTNHGPFPNDILEGMLASGGATADSVQQLDKFVESFFIFIFPKNFFIQMAVAGSWICLLIIVGSIVILQRMRKRAFWLFKFQRRSEGIYVVPNALNAFLVFEGLFGIVWVAFLIVQYRAYWLETPTMQYHIGVFNLMIWWPLWIGAFLAGWGSFYTAPGALDKGPLSSSKVGRWAPGPFIINTICLGTPVVLIVSLLAPIILTQINFNSAFNAYQTLHANLLSAIASSSNQTLSPSTSQLYLDQASQVWEMQTKSAWYQSIGFGIWSVWAGIFLLFYVPAGGYLCYMVWKQLQAQKAMLMDLEVKKFEVEEIDRRKASMQRGQVEALLFQPLSTSVPSDQQEGDRKGSPGTTLSGSPHLTSEQAAAKDNTAEKSGEDEYFFPPLRPEIRRRALKKINVGGTPRSRYKYLRRCFINLFILFIGIVLGAALYLGVSASLARSQYESYLRSPQDCTHVIYVACVVTAWGAVLFGTLTVAAIIARFADPANFTSSDDNEGERPHKKSGFFSTRLRPTKRNKNDRTLAETGQGQDKTRTLPAVPESVLGGTMDESMQSQGTSSNRGLIPPRRGLLDVMNFKVQNRAGKMILRPTDASSFQQPDSTSEMMMEELRSDGSRRVPCFVPQDMSQGSIFEGELQTSSGRSYREGSVVLQATPHGDMPCPAPIPKPLAPERSPPLSPVGIDMPTSPRLAVMEIDQRKRPSEGEIGQQHYASLHRRFSENSKAVREQNFSMPLKSQGASHFDHSPTALPMHLRNTPSAPHVGLSIHSGPVPPTPSTASTTGFPNTASTADFPSTPGFQNWQFPEQWLNDRKRLVKSSVDTTNPSTKVVRSSSARAPITRQSPGVFF